MLKEKPLTQKSWIEVSRGALRHNASSLRRVIGRQVKFMAVVKANAYGHGIAETVAALGHDGVNWFGVDSLEEAVIVRTAGARQPVLILGYVPEAGLKTAVTRGFSMVVYNLPHLALLNRLGTARRPAKVHLKIETGTSRQGITPADLPALAQAVRRLKHVVIEGVSTHYANIEDTTDPSYAMGQLRHFREALKVLGTYGVRPPLRHTAASAAAILYPETRFEMVRSGISLYGLWPSKETRLTATQMGLDLALHPALTWKSLVAQIKTLPAGTPVSYGLTEKVTRCSQVAIVPVGYYDGFDRGLSSIGHVLVGGKRAKVLGRVCMNMIVVDVTDIPEAAVEDEVVLLGRQDDELITAEEIAGKAGTINYEVVARLNPLLPRRLVR